MGTPSGRTGGRYGKGVVKPVVLGSDALPAQAPNLRDNPGAARAVLAMLLDIAHTAGLLDENGRVRIPADPAEEASR